MSRERELLIEALKEILWVATRTSSGQKARKAIDDYEAAMIASASSYDPDEPVTQQIACMNEKCDMPEICETLEQCCAVKDQHVAGLAAVARHNDGETPETDEIDEKVISEKWFGERSALQYEYSKKCRSLEFQRNELSAEVERLRAQIAGMK